MDGIWLMMFWVVARISCSSIRRSIRRANEVVKACNLAYSDYHVCFQWLQLCVSSDMDVILHQQLFSNTYGWLKKTKQKKR